MEVIQRRATKIVLSLKDMSYDEKLKRLGLTTLRERSVRGDIFEVFKIFNGIEKIDQGQFFVKKNRLNIRGHPKKLTVKYSHTEKRKKFFSQRKIKKSGSNLLDEDWMVVKVR